MTNIINFNDIILQNKNNFTKIQFDISTIKNKEKIYNIYNIQPGEKILAYCKKHILGITVNGSIFTDKAFYPRPAFLTSAPTKGDLLPIRIDYQDFCKYLIIQSDEKSGVYMRNAHHDYLVCYESLIGKNVLGYEMWSILSAIQMSLYYGNADNKKYLDDVAENLFQKVQSELKSGNLLCDTSDTLKGLVHVKPFRTRAVELLAESTYRLCDKSGYMTFITSISNYLSKEEADRLTNIPKEFRLRMTEDLSNPNLTFASDYINLILKNLRHAEQTEENLKLLIFSYIRADRMFEARMQIYNLIRKFGRKSAYIAEDLGLRGI